MDPSRLQDLIHKHGLADYRDDILALVRPATYGTYTVCRKNETVPIGCSKDGGMADLPARLDEIVPASARLLVQINMSEARDSLPVPFPENLTHLYIFESQETEGASVYAGFVEDQVDDLRRRPVNGEIYPESRITFSKAISFPNVSNLPPETRLSELYREYLTISPYAPGDAKRGWLKKTLGLHVYTDRYKELDTLFLRYSTLEGVHPHVSNIGFTMFAYPESDHAINELFCDSFGIPREESSRIINIAQLCTPYLPNLHFGEGGVYIAILGNPIRNDWRSLNYRTIRECDGVIDKEKS